MYACVCAHRLYNITMSRCIGFSILLICLILPPCPVISRLLAYLELCLLSLIYLFVLILIFPMLCSPLRIAPCACPWWPVADGLSPEPALRLLSSRLFPSLYVFLLQVPSFFTCLLSLSVFSHPVP